MPPDVKGRPLVTSQEGGPDAYSANITVISITPDPGETRFIAALPDNIAARIVVDPESGCWLWDGPVDKDGYGKLGGRGVHRIVFEILREPIPPGLVLDHRDDWGCVSRRCCYPWHVLPCTNAQNVLRGNSFSAINSRKTECDHGHQFTEANTYRPPGRRRRECRACVRQRVHDYQARLRERGQLARAA